MDPLHRDAAFLSVCEGLSQQKIADRLGVPQRTISDWLRRPEVADYCADLARELEAETIRTIGATVRKNAARLQAMADKFAWRLQLDDGKPDFPPGRPNDIALFADRFLDVEKRLTDREAHAQSMRQARELHAQRLRNLQSGVSPGPGESEAGDDSLPDNNRTY